MKKLTAVIFAIILIMSALSCSVDEKEYLLTFKFTEGQTLVYEQITKGYISNVEGEKTLFNNELHQVDTLKFEVLKMYEDSSARILITTTFNFKDIEDNAIFSKDSNIVFTDSIKVTKYGNLVHDYNKQTFTVDSILSNYKYVQYPEYPLSKGQKWNRTIQDSTDFVMLEVTYLLHSIVKENGKELVVLKFEGFDSFSRGTELVDKKGDESEYSFSSKGTLYLDYIEGYIQKQTESRTFSTNKYKQVESGDSVKVTLEYTTTTSIELIDVL